MRWRGILKTCWLRQLKRAAVAYAILAIRTASSAISNIALMFTGARGKTVKLAPRQLSALCKAGGVRFSAGAVRGEPQIQGLELVLIEISIFFKIFSKKLPNARIIFCIRQQRGNFVEALNIA